MARSGDTRRLTRGDVSRTRPGVIGIIFLAGLHKFRRAALSAAAFHY
jgi:hypothetical protein